MKSIKRADFDLLRDNAIEIVCGTLFIGGMTADQFVEWWTGLEDDGDGTSLVRFVEEAPAH